MNYLELQKRPFHAECRWSMWTDATHAFELKLMSDELRVKVDAWFGEHRSKVLACESYEEVLAIANTIPEEFENTFVLTYAINTFGEFPPGDKPEYEEYLTMWSQNQSFRINAVTGLGYVHFSPVIEFQFYNRPVASV